MGIIHKDVTMERKEYIEKLSKSKEKELLKKYFGNLVKEAAKERPETYYKGLPEEYARSFLCARVVIPLKRYESVCLTKQSRVIELYEYGIEWKRVHLNDRHSAL